MCLQTHVYTLILYNERPWINDILVAKSIPVLRSWGSVFFNIHNYISFLVVRIFKV